MNPSTIKFTVSPFYKRLLRHDGGVAIVEFGLMLPVLMTLFYGVVEVTRYILIVQKTEKLAHSVADATAQTSVATVASLDQVVGAASDIMNPHPFDANGRIIVSSLYRAPGAEDATVSWRYAGGGTLAAISHLGNVGDAPAMPVAFTFDERENVIAAEVFYRFSPLLTDRFFGTRTIYRAAFYRPRFGALTSPPT